MPRDNWRYATEQPDDELDEPIADDEAAEGEETGVDNDAVLELGLKLNGAVRDALLAFKGGDPDRIRLLKVAERLQARLHRLNKTMEAADAEV